MLQSLRFRSCMTKSVTELASLIANPVQKHNHYQFTQNTEGNRVVLAKTVVLGLVYLDRKEFSSTSGLNIYHQHKTSCPKKSTKTIALIESKHLPWLGSPQLFLHSLSVCFSSKCSNNRCYRYTTHYLGNVLMSLDFSGQIYKVIYFLVYGLDKTNMQN